MSPVADGQAVSAAITNPAFLDAQVDDTAAGKISFANSDAVSGGTITNVQRNVNQLHSFLGSSPNGVYNALPSWSSNDVGASTDSVKVRADNLSAEFNPTTGHKHTGAAGDAPKIPLAGLGALTTKGDLLTFNGSVHVVQSVGANGTALIADSTTSTGLRFALISALAYQETPAGTVNGVNDTFGPLTQTPSDSNSILVMVDMIPVPKTGWSLSGLNIVFASGYIPTTDQSVYVYYLYGGSGGGGGGGGGGVTPHTEYRTLTSGEASAKQITLASAPVSAGEVQLDVIGGGPQFYTDDFTVAGAVLSWSGLGLDGVLVTGDKLRVYYWT
jgi:hypothetical protein